MNMASEKYESISLFSGAMGLDIGLEYAGIHNRLCQEADKDCCDTIEANGKKVARGDIRKYTGDDLLRISGLKRGEPFVIAGGPPCQPFSTAGKRKGVNDPRGSLFKDFVRMINEIRPRFFVFENVKNLLTIPVEPGAGTGSVFQIIYDEISKLDYKIEFSILDAVDYGVPQFRERLIILGSRDHEKIFLPIATHHGMHQESYMRWNTLWDTISGLEDRPGPCASFSEERLRYLRMVPEGGNWRNLPPDVRQEAMGGAWQNGGGNVGYYRRLSYLQPSPTLTTSPIQKSTMMCHPRKDRPLSVAEYKAIQMFPDEWKISGTLASQYRQIGNAVPIPLGRAIGKALIATAKGNAEVMTKRKKAEQRKE